MLRTEFDRILSRYFNRDTYGGTDRRDKTNMYRHIHIKGAGGRTGGLSLMSVWCTNMSL